MYRYPLHIGMSAVITVLAIPLAAHGDDDWEDAYEDWKDKVEDAQEDWEDYNEDRRDAERKYRERIRERDWDDDDRVYVSPGYTYYGSTPRYRSWTYRSDPDDQWTSRSETYGPTGYRSYTWRYDDRDGYRSSDDGYRYDTNRSTYESSRTVPDRRYDTYDDRSDKDRWSGRYEADRSRQRYWDRDDERTSDREAAPRYIERERTYYHYDDPDESYHHGTRYGYDQPRDQSTRYETRTYIYRGSDDDWDDDVDDLWDD